MATTITLHPQDLIEVVDSLDPGLFDTTYTGEGYDLSWLRFDSINFDSSWLAFAATINEYERESCLDY